MLTYYERSVLHLLRFAVYCLSLCVVRVTQVATGVPIPKDWLTGGALLIAFGWFLWVIYKTNPEGWHR